MVQEERNHYWIDLSENKKINVERYNPEWKNWFESLQSTAWAVVKPWALSIEHVGSTAIEGLSAKPIIDIDIVVENIKALGPTISALESIGYLHRGNLGIEGRERRFVPQPQLTSTICMFA
ncbi:MAG: GrpB family protein [Bdellovibrionaceae bacterium]|nr:GrpB family protein [Pseudobdellovibrionaceae bacterium]